jgi:DNA-binding PadR family transcriptional regulator
MVRTMEASLLEFVLLGLLDQGGCSGYDLRKLFAASPLRNFSDSPGAIYPALRRLAGRGWIDGQEPGGSRKRQVFAIHERGRAALAAWLRRSVLPDDVLHPELLLLRFAFMGQILTRDEVLAFLAQFEQHLVPYVASLEAYFAGNAAAFPLTGRLSFVCGLGEYRAKLQWLQEARRAVASSEEWPLQ